MMENGLPAHAGMWDGPTFPMCLKNLIYNHKNTENEVYYTAENLANREIRINTHRLRASICNKSMKLQWIRKIYIDKGSPFSPDKLSKSYHTSALPVKVGEEFPCPRCNAAYGKFPSASSRDFLYHPNNKPINNMLKQRRFILTIVLAVLLFPLTLAAQEKPDTVYTFRFVTDKDMFYVPFSGNDKELARLEECVERYRQDILAGKIPLHVDGWCTAGESEADNLAMAKVRSNRVK